MLGSSELKTCSRFLSKTCQLKETAGVFYSCASWWYLNNFPMLVSVWSKLIIVHVILVMCWVIHACHLSQSSAHLESVSRFTKGWMMGMNRILIWRGDFFNYDP
jgi:hypothetical protein